MGLYPSFMGRGVSRMGYLFLCGLVSLIRFCLLLCDCGVGLLTASVDGPNSCPQEGVMYLPDNLSNRMEHT